MTKNEISEIIRRYYPDHGTKRVQSEILMVCNKKMSLAAIRARARALGVSSNLSTKAVRSGSARRADTAKRKREKELELKKEREELNTSMEIRKKAKDVEKEIRYQFNRSPEGALMFEVVAQAIRERFGSLHHWRDAKQYLQGTMYHAQLAGVDPEWVRHKIKQEGLHL